MNNVALKVSILLTGVLLTVVNYKLKPSPSEKEIRQQSIGMSGGVDWRNHTAPDFEITTTQGERFRLSDNVGKKVVVLNFFATWCGLVPSAAPLRQSETYVYDALGRLQSKRDFNSKTTTYNYDSMDRLLSKVPDPSLSQPTNSFTYTATGQRLSDDRPERNHELQRV